MSRITDLDRHIATRLVEFRKANPTANMSRLARYLGIAYQSYQALERGTVSFRASTLQRIASFYNTTIEGLIGTDLPETLPNMDRIQHTVLAMKKLPPTDAAEVLRFALDKVRENKSGA